LIRVVLGVVVGSAALGCGTADLGPLAAQNAKVADSARPEPIPITAAARTGAPKDTALTIRTFPDGFPFTGHTENAMLVAFEDGDGSWVALTGVGGIYHATATQPRYGVAVGCVAEFQAGVQLYYQAVSEITDLPVQGCFSNVDTVHITIDVQGLSLDETAEVWLGGNVGFGFAGFPAELDVPRGTVDVFARSYVGDGVGVPVNLYRGPTVDLQTDQSMTIDMAAVGQPPEPHPLSVPGVFSGPLPPDVVQVHSSYATPHSQVNWPLFDQEFFEPLAALTPPVVDHYQTFDATARAPGDVSNVTVLARGSTAEGQRYTRYVRLAMKIPTAPTLKLPDVLSVGAPTIDAAPTPRVTLVLPITPSVLGTADYTVFVETPSSDIQFHEWSLQVRSGWAQGQPSVTIVTPDLSDLPGWSPDMALTAGVPLSWFIERDDRNMPIEALPSDGRHILGSSLFGTNP
jgi:hypothetical protein